MKKFSCLLLVIMLMGLSPRTDAQVTNLTVNGSGTSFTMISGDNIGWEYNIPIGGTALCEIWIDVDQNGSIDQGVDRLYMSFTQTDGDTVGGNGPPDMDGMANGHVLFSQSVGIAPATFVMRFAHNNVGMTIPGTMLPLTSPAHTLSGHVTPPPGRSAQYILLEAQRDQNYSPEFWHAITDSSGNYAIQMNADTAGNPWRVTVVENPYPPSIISPAETSITITGNHSGINFEMLQAAAQVTGYVKDENDNPMSDIDVQLRRNDGLVWHDFRTNVSGFYQVGVLSGELLDQTWRLQTGNMGPFNTTTLTGQRTLPIIYSGDSLSRQIVVYNVNAQIQGQVRVNGGVPGFPITIVAMNADTAQSVVSADGGTGNFTVGVTDRIYNYQLFPINLPPNYNSPTVNAHPGDTGVIIDIIVTSVDEGESGIPREFVLKQNYPNPFNPSTTIEYSVPERASVEIKVLDVLGREVTTLLNEEKPAGAYTVRWDADGVASGVYFYRLKAGRFVQTREMVLMR